MNDYEMTVYIQAQITVSRDANSTAVSKLENLLNLRIFWGFNGSLLGEKRLLLNTGAKFHKLACNLV